MRTRRLLLAASALSTLTFGCSKSEPEKPRDPDTTNPLPGNPKGTFYDDAMVVPVVADAGVDAEVLPLPGNPKGTLYDAGVDVKPLRPPPRDAAIRRLPPDGPPLKSNPKGSLYDKGHDKNDSGL